MNNLFVPLAGALLALAPAAAFATNYAATPIVPAAPARINASDIVWGCGPAACLGNSMESRPLVLCQDLASRVGKLANFVVDGRNLASDQLDRCNARARSGTAPLLAKAK